MSNATLDRSDSRYLISGYALRINADIAYSSIPLSEALPSIPSLRLCPYNLYCTYYYVLPQKNIALFWIILQILCIFVSKQYISLRNKQKS